MNKSEPRSNAQGTATGPAPAAPASIQDEACVELLHRATSHTPGIIHVDLDAAHETVSIAYNPDVVAEDEVARVAQGVAPAIHNRLDRCTMRLEHHGGRSCESCALVLENRLKQIPGVRGASASYMGGVLSVSYDRAMLSPDTLAQKVKEMRVPVAPVAPAVPIPAEEAETAPAEAGLFSRLRGWLTVERLEAVLMVATFVAMMLALVAENVWRNDAVTATLYVVAYVAGGAFGLKGGIESLMHATIDVDLLMVLAALGAAFVGAPFEGAMLLFLFSLSNVLQAFAMDRTRNAIRALMKLRPKHATVRRGEGTEVVPIERVAVGDVILVKPGERVALDGLVSAGESTVDQSSITGESIPVGKRPGDTVYAGTINKNGSLDVTVTKRAEDSTLAHLIKLVEEAQSEKAKTQRFIDRFEQVYAVVVILATILAVIVPIAVFSEAFEPAFYRAMTIMVAASPCALVISTPASILSAIGNGARRGVLF
jgi:Cd2+/Zn2+-exporting ATPase